MRLPWGRRALRSTLGFLPSPRPSPTDEWELRLPAMQPSKTRSLERRLQPLASPFVTPVEGEASAPSRFDRLGRGTDAHGMQ